MHFKWKPDKQDERTSSPPAEAVSGRNPTASRTISGDKVHVKDVSSQQQTNRIQGRDVTEDLIRRVGAAIDDWARINGLSVLPRHIIFQQALSILNAVDRNITPKN